MVPIGAPSFVSRFAHNKIFRFLKYIRLYNIQELLVPPFAHNKICIISDAAPWCQSRCQPPGAQSVTRGSRGRPGPEQGWSAQTWSL